MSNTNKVKLCRRERFAKLKKLKRSKKLKKSRRKGIFGRAKISRKTVIPYAQHDSNSFEEIVLPEKIDLINDYKEGCLFFRRLRKTLKNRTIRAFFIDHSQQKFISPEAALLLTAELYRANKTNTKAQVNCNAPADAKVNWILEQVDYFKYLKEFKGALPTQQYQQRRYLRHIHSNRVQSVAASELIDHFKQYADFSLEAERSLYNALIESMTNVAEHAYPKKKPLTKIPIYAEWWIAGYYDVEEEVIGFTFFDQGVGIPATIRVRLKDKFRSGSSLIRQAVECGKSRTQLPTRGTGLPSLKEFVDASSGGALVICSHESSANFTKESAPVTQDLNFALPGTLISWRVKTEKHHPYGN